MNLGLRAHQKCRPHLRSAGTQHQRRRHPARIGDPPGRDHRNFHRIHNCGQQRKQSDLLRLGLGRVEATAMSACLHPLRHHHVGPRRFCRAGFGDG